MTRLVLLLTVFYYVGSIFAADAQKFSIEEKFYVITDSPPLDTSSQLVNDALKAVVESANNESGMVARRVQHHQIGRRKVKFVFQDHEYRASHNSLIMEDVTIQISSLKLEKLVARKELSKDEQVAKL